MLAEDAKPKSSALNIPTRYSKTPPRTVPSISAPKLEAVTLTEADASAHQAHTCRQAVNRTLGQGAPPSPPKPPSRTPPHPKATMTPMARAALATQSAAAASTTPKSKPPPGKMAITSTAATRHACLRPASTGAGAASGHNNPCKDVERDMRNNSKERIEQIPATAAAAAVATAMPSYLLGDHSWDAVFTRQRTPSVSDAGDVPPSPDSRSTCAMKVHQALATQAACEITAAMTDAHPAHANDTVPASQQVPDDCMSPNPRPEEMVSKEQAWPVLSDTFPQGKPPTKRAFTAETDSGEAEPSASAAPDEWSPPPPVRRPPVPIPMLQLPPPGATLDEWWDRQPYVPRPQPMDMIQPPTSARGSVLACTLAPAQEPAAAPLPPPGSPPSVLSPVGLSELSPVGLPRIEPSHSPAASLHVQSVVSPPDKAPGVAILPAEVPPAAVPSAATPSAEQSAGASLETATRAIIQPSTTPILSTSPAPASTTISSSVFASSTCVALDRMNLNTESSGVKPSVAVRATVSNAVTTESKPRTIPPVQRNVEKRALSSTLCRGRLSQEEVTQRIVQHLSGNDSRLVSPALTPGAVTHGKGTIRSSSTKQTKKVSPSVSLGTPAHPVTQTTPATSVAPSPPMTFQPESAESAESPEPPTHAQTEQPTPVSAATSAASAAAAFLGDDAVTALAMAAAPLVHSCTHSSSRALAMTQSEPIPVQLAMTIRRIWDVDSTSRTFSISLTCFTYHEAHQFDDILTPRSSNKGLKLVNGERAWASSTFNPTLLVADALEHAWGEWSFRLSPESGPHGRPMILGKVDLTAIISQSFHLEAFPFDYQLLGVHISLEADPSIAFLLPMRPDLPNGRPNVCDVAYDATHSDLGEFCFIANCPHAQGIRTLRTLPPKSGPNRLFGAISLSQAFVHIPVVRAGWPHLSTTLALLLVISLSICSTFAIPAAYSPLRLAADLALLLTAVAFRLYLAQTTPRTASYTRIDVLVSATFTLLFVAMCCHTLIYLVLSISVPLAILADLGGWLLSVMGWMTYLVCFAILTRMKLREQEQTTRDLMRSRAMEHDRDIDLEEGVFAPGASKPTLDEIADARGRGQGALPLPRLPVMRAARGVGIRAGRIRAGTML